MQLFFLHCCTLWIFINCQDKGYLLVIYMKSKIIGVRLSLDKRNEFQALAEKMAVPPAVLARSILVSYLEGEEIVNRWYNKSRSQSQGRRMEKGNRSRDYHTSSHRGQTCRRYDLMRMGKIRPGESVKTSLIHIHNYVMFVFISCDCKPFFAMHHNQGVVK